jgi:hypothetical protein
MAWMENRRFRYTCWRFFPEFVPVIFWDVTRNELPSVALSG